MAKNESIFAQTDRQTGCLVTPKHQVCVFLCYANSLLTQTSFRLKLVPDSPTFFVMYDSELNIFGFWNIGWTKHDIWRPHHGATFSLF